jgi:hypothetical protein
MKREYLKKIKTTAELQGLRELAKRSRLSRQSLYNLFQKNDFKVSTLEAVTRGLGYKLEISVEPATDMDKETIYSALRTLGAPFYENRRVNFPPEDILIMALNQSLVDATVADVLPYVLALNVEKLDLFVLVNAIRTPEQRQLLGYFSELANKFAPSQKLGQLLEWLYGAELTELSLIPQKQKIASRLLENVNNPSAKKWRILTFSSEHDYLKRCKKWREIKN